MSFNIGGIAIDHIAMGIFETSAGVLAYTLSQLSEASINISTESSDITDARGVLVRRKYTGKTGEFTSSSAFIDLNIAAAASGTEVEKGSSGSTIKAPYIATVAKKEKEHTIEGLVAESVQIIGINGSGAEVERYTKGADGTKEFAVAGTKITLPTDAAEDVVNYVITAERDTEKGMKVINTADKFPKAGVLTLKALAIDPCDKDGLVACYIKCPNFTPNPDLELSLSNDGDNTMAYNGTLAADYCGSDKTLVEIYLVEDGDE